MINQYYTPTIRLKKGVETTVLAGMPWIYAGELVEASDLLLIPPGSLVSIENVKGQPVGVGHFNGKSQIACRVLTLGREPIDAAFFRRRLEKALAMHDRLAAAPPGLQAEIDGENRLVMSYKPSQNSVQDILDMVQASGVSIADMITREADLEDIFIHLTRQDKAA